MNKIAIIKYILDQKAIGVEYLVGKGAACPICGRDRCKTYRTMKREGSTQIRYHKCQNCLAKVKSVQNFKK